MALSLPDIRTTRPRNKLFFGGYSYSIGFTLPFAHLVRRYQGQTPTHDAVKRRWDLSNYLNDTVRNYGGRWSRNHDMPDAAMLENLLHWNEWLREHQSQVKYTVKSDRCYTFCNDLTTVSEVLSLPYVKDPVIQQAQVVSSADEIPLQSSCWQYRTYIKSMKVPSNVRHSLGQMLAKQEDQSQSSLSLRNWLEHGEGRSAREYFYVDHNDTGVILMMNLICPGLSGKTYRIVSVGK